MTLYVANAVLTSIVAGLLGFIIVIDWPRIRPMWRPILIAGAIQQVVLVYGCYEALQSHVALEARQVLFFGSVLAMMLAILLGITLGYREGQLTLPFLHRRRH